MQSCNLFFNAALQYSPIVSIRRLTVVVERGTSEINSFTTLAFSPKQSSALIIAVLTNSPSENGLTGLKQKTPLFWLFDQNL